MNRLLLVTTIPAMLQGFLTPIATHFRRQGWQVDALTADQPIDSLCRKEFDRIWTVEWSRNPLLIGHLHKTQRIIREIIVKEQYDIVHVHTPVAAFVTRYALRDLHGTGRPIVVYTAHGFHFHSGGRLLTNVIFRGLECLAGRWTDYLVVINREDEGAAQRHRIVPQDRIRYMPGIGIDLNSYSPDSVAPDEIARARVEMKLASGNRLFILVGELNANKRQRDALHALALLGRPEIHLACAGQGPLHEELTRLADELGVRQQIHFLGFRRDIPVLMCAAEATLLISQREGLPRSVMESLCLGIPVIGANTRGIRDLICAGAGLIVNVGDIEKLARAMEWVLDNPERARKLGQQGRSQMWEYDLHRIITLHEELYIQALAYTPGSTVSSR